MLLIPRSKALELLSILHIITTLKVIDKMKQKYISVIYIFLLTTSLRKCIYIFFTV